MARYSTSCAIRFLWDKKCKGGNVKLTHDQKISERERKLWSMIGTRLKIARKAALLSQAAMAEKLGISRARWSMYELGKRPIRMIHVFEANAILTTNWDYLFEGDEARLDKAVRSRMRAARQLEEADGG
jgi:DNA-binding XRE family transcriptional regulator